MPGVKRLAGVFPSLYRSHLLAAACGGSPTYFAFGQMSLASRFCWRMYADQPRRAGSDGQARDGAWVTEPTGEATLEDLAVKRARPALGRVRSVQARPPGPPTRVLSVEPGLLIRFQPFGADRLEASLGTSGSYSPLTLTGTATESYTGGATCGEKVGEKAAKAVKKGTFRGSTITVE